MRPDYSESVRFLKLIYPTGPWMLTAISVDKRSIEARTLFSEDEVVGWLNLHKQKNLYYSVNEPVKEAYEKRKLLKSDVSRVHYLHVDCDPRAGEDVEAEQVRILHELESYPIPPTAIVFSGGGYNALWKLTEPVDIAAKSPNEETSINRAIDVERRNWQLELDFNTPDHCRDISRILRLPGTINRPNAKKIAAGRTPALAEIHFIDASLAYPLSGFGKTPVVSSNKQADDTLDVQRIEDLDELGTEIPERLKIIIAQGFDPEDGNYDGDRSNPLFFVCCELVRYGVKDEIILGIITDPRFLISSSVLDKGSAQQRYALRQISRAKDKAFHPKLAEMNEKYAVIANYGGRCFIMHEDTREFVRPREFFDATIHEKITWKNAKGKEVVMGAGKWWFEQKRRRQYDRVVFEPGLIASGSFNLWNGFTVEPIKGDKHKRWLEHTFENVCRGVQENFDYLIKWLARVVQFPRTQSMVAPVLLGDRGTGKSVFATFYGALFGKHAYVASDIRELTGRFNAHLASSLFVLAEEAFDMRDKRHESVLKERITGQRIGVEKKGVDIIQMTNYMHLMLTSNNERVVPAGDKERRFFVIRIKERTHNDQYFLDIIDDCKNGGLPNLLYYLLNVDLSHYNVTNVPFTKELREQQEHNIIPELDWLLEKLENGIWLPGCKWEDLVLKEHLYDDYMEYIRNGVVRFPRTRRAFTLWLGKEFPNARSQQVSPGRNPARPWAWKFPPLEECRTQFLKNRGWKNHDWQTPISVVHSNDQRVI